MKKHDHSISSFSKKFSAHDYIQKLKLEKHPEGGYFSLNYKSTDVVVPLNLRYRDPVIEKNNSIERTLRFAGSSIYFLLDKEDFSAWHQLRSDEIWHYYDGDSPIAIARPEARGSSSGLESFLISLANSN